MILRIIIDILIVIGAIFSIAGTIGVIKMPDTFSRMQASTCISTLGFLGLSIGGILYAVFCLHDGATAVKIGVICVLILVINPIGSHAIMKGAYRSGIRPDKEMTVDDFRRDFNE